MNKFKIRIDRASIKHNENAGATELSEYLYSTGDIKVTVPSFLAVADKRLANVEFMDDRLRAIGMSTSISRGGGFHQSVDYVVGGMSVLELIMLTDALIAVFGRDNVSSRFENHFETIHLMTPIPPFSFKYEENRVQCCHCKATFKYTELRDEDDYDYEDNYVGRANICPRCDNDDCCEIEFESLESVALEEAGLPKMVIR